MRGTSSSRRRRTALAAALVALASTGAAASLALGASTRAGDTTSVASGPNGSVTFTQIQAPPPPPVTPPQLSTAVSFEPDTPIAGTPFVVAVDVSDGNVSLQSTVLTVTGFGSGLTVQSVAAPGGSCPTDAGLDQYVCPLGPIGPGGHARVAFTVLAAGAGSFQVAGALKTNALLINSSGSGTVSVVAPSADLAVRVPGVTLRPRVGGTARLGIQVTSGGPSATTAAVLHVMLPPQVSLVRATTTAGTCGGTPLICNLGGLASPQTDLVVLTLSGVKAGTGTLTASVSGDLEDGTAANNGGSLQIVVPKPRPKPARPKKPVHKRVRAAPR